MKILFLNDPFYITLLLIIVAFIVGVISKARNKDRCLKHFKNYLVSIESIEGKIFTKGVLKVKSTGLEVQFPEIQYPAEGLEQATYLIYKYEFEKIQAIILPLSELNKKGKKNRNKKYKIIKSPGFGRKIIRKTRNTFNSLKDSFVEVMNLSISYLTTKKAKALKPHDKYVKSLNSELMESVGLSHDPLLEEYIGEYVIFEFLKDNKKILFKGILYDYTKKFIEILDVDYKIGDSNDTIKADLILPQNLTVVRGLCEQELFGIKFLNKYIKNKNLG